MFNAKRFINAEAKDYENIEDIGRKLNKIRFIIIDDNF